LPHLVPEFGVVLEPCARREQVQALLDEDAIQRQASRVRRRDLRSGSQAQRFGAAANEEATRHDNTQRALTLR